MLTLQVWGPFRGARGGQGEGEAQKTQAEERTSPRGDVQGWERVGLGDLAVGTGQGELTAPS